MKIKEIVMREAEDVKIEPAPDSAKAVGPDGKVIAQGPAGALQAAQDAGVDFTPSDETASEEYEEEGQHHGHHDISLDSFMNSEYAPFDDDSGDYRAVHNKARNFLHGKVHPSDIDQHAERLNREFHGEHEMDEQHHDLMPANKPVSRDGTDAFLKDVTDTDFERAQGRHDTMESADDELLRKMLSIAGIK